MITVSMKSLRRTEKARRPLLPGAGKSGPHGPAARGLAKMLGQILTAVASTVSSVLGQVGSLLSGLL